MPLQQIQLDQSIYQRPPWKKEARWGAQTQRSPVSEALTPQPSVTKVGGAMPQGKGFMEKHEEQQALEAERKYQEKMMKLQHEQEMEKMKFTAGLREDAQKQQQAVSQQATMAQVQQQGATRQKIEANPEPAAEEMHDLILSMPEETQSTLLNQIFTPTTPKGSISSAGKTVTMPEKYNPIAGVFLSKGWATIDEAGNPVLSKPEREFEKTTFKEMENGDILNTATGEVIANKNDLPKGLTVDEVKEGYTYGMNYMGKLMEPAITEKITPKNMAGHIERSKAESRLQTEAFLTGILQGKGMSRDEAKAEAKRIAYNMSFEEVSGIGKGEGKGRQKPLDEGIAKDIAAHLKITPDADIEAYRDEYGDATVDKALELNKEPEVKPEPLVKPKVKEAPLTTAPSAFDTPINMLYP